MLRERIGHYLKQQEASCYNQGYQLDFGVKQLRPQTTSEIDVPLKALMVRQPTNIGMENHR